jgi:hypothetical protein
MHRARDATHTAIVKSPERRSFSSMSSTSYLRHAWGAFVYKKSRGARGTSKFSQRSDIHQALTLPEA